MEESCFNGFQKFYELSTILFTLYSIVMLAHWNKYEINVQNERNLLEQKIFSLNSFLLLELDERIILIVNWKLEEFKSLP